MAVDERKRHEMYLSLERTIGREAADTLMELVPPVGWADVATKQDLSALEERLDLLIDAKLHAGLNAQTKTLVVTMVGTTIGGMVSVAVLAFAAARLT